MKKLYFFVVFITCAVSAQAQDLNRWTVHQLDSVVALLYGQGQFEQAIPYAQKCVEKAKNEADTVYAQSLSDLGVLYRYAGRYEESETVFSQSHHIFIENKKELTAKCANNLNNWSALYIVNNKLQEAEKLLLKAQAIPALPTNIITNSKNNLALVYQKMGEPEKAEQLFKEIIDIRTKAGGAGSLQIVTPLNNLGLLYISTKRFDLAEKYLRETLKIYETNLGTAHSNYFISLDNLGLLYLTMGDTKKGMGFYQQSLFYNAGKSAAIDISDEWADVLLASNFASYSSALSSLFGIYNALASDSSQIDKQYLVCQTALKISQKAKTQFNLESDKLRILSTTHSWVARVLDAGIALPNQKENLFIYSEYSKAALLADATKTQRARTFGDLPDSLANTENALQKELSQLKKNINQEKDKDKKAQLQAELGNLNLKIDKLKNQIESDFPKYHQLKYAAADVDIKALQNTLPDKTALLEYFVQENKIYIFCIDKTDLQVIEIPIEKKNELTEQIAALRRALSDYEWIKNEPESALQTYTSTAFWFYQKLIAPALQQQKDWQHLVFIPDGALGHLPFEVFLATMPSPEQKNYASFDYLLKKYKISYDYSAALWKENSSQNNRQNNKLFLAMAAEYNPQQASDSAMLLLRSPHTRLLRGALQPLPSAQKEVELLEKSFEGSFLSGDASNETFFKQNAAQYAVVHLAMHGILDKQAPLFSSLAFSENKDPKEDNLLEAWEIAASKLNADLVVLSACETGYGKLEKGEGVMSLARSFMYAGVPSLVVSLWSVNDASTAQLMEYFYQALAQNQDKAEALRQAKLQYLENSKGNAAHPAFWAPFIQIGSSKAFELTPKKKSQWWLWAAGGGLAAGAFLLLIKKKKTDE